MSISIPDASPSNASPRPIAYGRRCRAAAVLTVAALFVVGCSDDEKPSALCNGIEHLQASVEELRGIDVVADGTNAASGQVDEVLQDLTDLREAAGDDLGPQIDAVTESIDALTQAIEGSSSAGEAARAVVDHGGQINETLGALRSAASDALAECN